MKKLKKFNKMLRSFILSIITITILSLFNFVQAANAGPLYLGIELYRNTGYAYRQGQLEIFKILSYTSADKTSRVSKESTIYCIKGGTGFGSANPSTTGAIAYTNKFDLRNLSAIPSPYKDVLPTGENYNKLMWVLDHLFIMPENPQEDNKTEREDFLSKVIPEEFYEKLTNDDIDVVQQMAIWYFTNPNDNWHFGNANLKIKKAGEEYESIFNIDEDRDDAITALYDYYITSAPANYVSPTVNTNAKPIQIEDKSNGKMQTIGTNYVAGPYKINQVLDLGYNITEVKYNDGAITPKIGVKDQNGNIVATSKTIKDLIGQEFYLVVPTSSNITQLTMKISGTYTVRQEWYWSTETDLENNQPVVIVEEESKPFEDAVASKVENKKVFDMSLRKFITEINDKKIEELGLTSRIPNVEGLDALKNGTSGTAIYKHLKTPVKVNIGDIVTYTIRVYNEGELDGYVTEITDHLPDQLEFLMNDSTNLKYGWKYDSGDTHTIKTNFLSDADGTTSENPEDNKMLAFNGTKLDYRDVQIRCKVVETANMPKKITNIAEITGCKDSEGNVITNPSTGERDSTVKNVTIPTDLPGYKDQEINRQDPTDPDYIAGQEDDDDFEKLILKEFDLSLKKFVTKVNDTEITNRDPQVDVSPLKGTGTTAKYTYKISPEKNPVVVENSDIVTYTIRIYNEGEANGYAEKIRDDIPAGLEFLPDNSTNIEYRWKMYDENNQETTDVSKAKTIATDYLSKTQEETSGRTNLLKAFEMTNTTLDYKDVKVAFKVIEPNSSKNIIINKAQIAEDSDNDRDSTPDQWIDGEDDQDIEKIRLKEFDLSLKKFITKVNDENITNREPQVDVTPLKNGQTTAQYTYKINPEKLPVVVSNGDIVTYTIRVYNEGEVSGYAEKVRDDIPEGLEFLPDNSTNIEYRWKMYDENNQETTDVSKAKTIATDYLSKAQEEETGRTNLLTAFSSDKDTLDYKDVKVAFKVIEPNSSKNIIINKAQIAEDSNDDRDSTPDQWIDGEDDQDIEKIRLKDFDLALRKFITKLNDKEIKNRVPQVELDTLRSGTTATYNHTKLPLNVYLDDIVEYTIRVYNEGDTDGYVTEITDYLPEQLELIPDNQTNIDNNWKMYDANNNETTDASKAVKIKTDKIKDDKIVAFDGDTLSYKDVKIVCKVVRTENVVRKITNIAEITKCENANRVEVKGKQSGDERDSNPNQVVVPTGTELENYKDDEINKEYVPGQEDDDDFEKLILKEFDLSLRKFITAVNDTKITNREPKVDVTPLKDGSKTTAIYEHPKDPVLVSNGNIVEYTIRVYNEGSVSGYAKEVKDDIPEGLEFLPDNEINKEYRWVMLDENEQETTKVEEAKTIATDYLSKEQEKTAGANLIKAFDPDTMETLDYKDVKVAFKVIEPTTSDRIIINKAQISKNTDENDDDVKDRDSTPDKWIEEDDDQDIEKVKVQYFDLSLRKWVTQTIVIEDGQERITETGHTAEDDPEAVAKVDLKKSKINNVIVKFRFKIIVKNEGTIAGYVKEIKDYIPDGLKFLEEDNPLWKKIDDKTITTDQCKDILLKPGDTTEVEVLLTWINGEDNMGVMDNWAEISEDYNEYGSPDIDSTPDNNKKDEDDIDDASVMVTVQTGEIAKYTGISIIVLTILTTGIVLIKKYVVN